MIFFNRSSAEFGMISKNDISDDVFLFPSERNRLKKIKHPARRAEFIGVRQLRNKMIPDHEIVYLASGKPTLNKGVLHISISHSEQTICLGLSKSNIGLDIEVPQDRILRIKSKFCSKEEATLFNEQSIYDMTLLWTLKEAAYKKTNQPGLNFLEEIKIIERLKNTYSCRATAKKKVLEFNLAHEEIDDQILTYTT